MIILQILYQQIALATLATHLKTSHITRPSYQQGVQRITRPLPHARPLQIRPANFMKDLDLGNLQGQLGNYRASKLVGTGKSGTVYKGYNNYAPEKKVAIKYFKDASDVQREAMMLDAAGRLIDRGFDFVVVPLYRGISLDKVIQLELVDVIYQPGNATRISQCLQRISQVRANCAASLRELSELGLKHNDLHLRNFLVNSQDLSCVVIDLGSASKTEVYQLKSEVELYKLKFDKDFKQLRKRIQLLKRYGISKKELQQTILQ